MSLDPQALARVAHLARLDLSADDHNGLTERLNTILAMVDRLQDADVSHLEPMAHPLDAVQTLRADEVTEPDVRAQVAPLAPAMDDGLYLVPRVIE
ncbi:Asp-tRNA(Asn)/Glu-tRNA(Gln) amidotransferase subunit GatC [Isoalcanivorax beigongshangi]|uniref:Aspartyl/glutamyl-tRNA(Asn/Gln) amidotransferase subunit C n=1 Tax=Isoalcanivorax beigongshangi TaxID=3238810 RepID=A0ABV4AIM8_9GAMM